MDLMTLSLLMVAGTPALAMAQGCTEAEAVLRADAAQLGPILTQLTGLSNEYAAKQRLIDDEYDYFYYYYGTAPDTAAGTYVGNLEAEKQQIQTNYDALVLTARPIDTRMTQLIPAYEAACGANARTKELLGEYQIVRNPPQGQ